MRVNYFQTIALLVFSYEHITPKSVFMLNCFFIQIFTSKFKSTGRATLHTILIDRQAFYSTWASGLQTNSQTDLNTYLHKLLKSYNIEFQYLQVSDSYNLPFSIEWPHSSVPAVNIYLSVFKLTVLVILRDHYHKTMTSSQRCIPQWKPQRGCCGPRHIGSWQRTGR